MPLSLSRLFALKLPGVPTSPAPVPVRSVTLALSSAGGVVGDALTATVHAWSGPSGTGTLLLGRSAALASSAPAVAAVSGHVVGLRVAGSAAITATCEGVTSPPVTVTVTAAAAAPPPAPVVVRFSAIRHDGLTGTAQLGGGVPLIPGQVHAADVANARVVLTSSGTEVQAVVTDRGGRHLDTADPTSLFDVWVEVIATHTDPNVHPQYELHFDGARTLARLTPAPYTTVSNRVIPSISGANPANFSVNNTGAIHWWNDDAVHRWQAGDVTAWDPMMNRDYSDGPQTFVQDPTQYLGLFVQLFANQAGALKAVPMGSAVSSDGTSYGGTQLNKATGGFGAYNLAGQSAVINIRRAGYRDIDPWQPIQTLVVVLKPASATDGTPASFTPGTTSLAAPIVSYVTLPGAVLEPMPVAAYDFPLGTCTPTDPAYLSRTRYTSRRLATATALAASGAHGTAYVGTFSASDDFWHAYGTNAFYGSGGQATYALGEYEWQDFAMTGALRRLRRAICNAQPWISYATATIGTGNTGWGIPADAWSVPPWMADGTMCPMKWKLTNDPWALAHLEDAVLVGSQNYTIDINESQSDHRAGWRALQAMAQCAPYGYGDGVKGRGIAYAAKRQEVANAMATTMQAATAPNAGLTRIYNKTDANNQPPIPRDPPAFQVGFFASYNEILAGLLGRNADLDRMLEQTYAFYRRAVVTATDARGAIPWALDTSDASGAWLGLKYCADFSPTNTPANPDQMPAGPNQQGYTPYSWRWFGGPDWYHLSGVHLTPLAALAARQTARGDTALGADTLDFVQRLAAGMFEVSWPGMSVGPWKNGPEGYLDSVQYLAALVPA